MALCSIFDTFCRLVEPAEGSIVIDGLDVSNMGAYRVEKCSENPLYQDGRASTPT